MNATWIVRVYNGDELIDQWTLEDRTEQQAESEVISEVQQAYVGLDWTLTRKEQDNEIVRNT